MQLNSSEKKSLNLSLTPLIDVVFLLLIFFMLASTFSRFSSLPLAVKSGQGQANPVQKFILVRVNKEGKIDVNGEEVPARKLIEAINKHAIEGGMKLLVKPTDGASVQHLVTILEMAKESKLKNPMVIR